MFKRAFNHAVRAGAVCAVVGTLGGLASFAGAAAAGWNGPPAVIEVETASALRADYAAAAPLPLRALSPEVIADARRDLPSTLLGIDVGPPEQLPPSARVAGAFLDAPGATAPPPSVQASTPEPPVAEPEKEKPAQAPDVTHTPPMRDPIPDPREDRPVPAADPLRDVLGPVVPALPPVVEGARAPLADAIGNAVDPLAKATEGTPANAPAALIDGAAPSAGGPAPAPPETPTLPIDAPASGSPSGPGALPDIPDLAGSGGGGRP